ncbi:MAG: Crp/Fnr family transcriptional regulator [Acidimicrobiales bacterium]
MHTLRHRDTYPKDLGSIAPFVGCADKELVTIDRFTTRHRVPTGTVLCQEGRVGREAFVIVDGEAAVTVGGTEIARLGPGSFCGEMALLERDRRSATVTTVTPTEVLVLSIADFDQLMAAAPTVTRRLLVSLSGRLRHADEEWSA